MSKSLRKRTVKAIIERVYFVTLGLLSMLSLATICAAHGIAGPRFNPTPSVPRGLYFYIPGPVHRGEYVQACLPERSALYAEEHHILGRGVCPNNVEPLVKILAAVPGDTVMVSATAIRINGHAWPMSAMRSVDRMGNRVDMHIPFGTYVLHKNQVLLLGFHPDSWDGRYFGVLPSSALTGRLFPLVTDKGFTL
jgi:conjugative transfer signal peptidase TraF